MKHPVKLGALLAVLTAAYLVPVSASASGTASGPPAAPITAPFQQCAAVYLDPSCGYLIDITGASASTVYVDPSVGYYEGADDVLVGIQNDSSAAISSIHVGVAGSGYGSFGFDGDGLCDPGGGPVPADCPFGPTSSTGGDYFGPDATLTVDPNPCPGASSGPCEDDGTVNFPTPLLPGQYTYVSLEAPFDGAAVVTGTQNDVIQTALSDGAYNTGSHIQLSAPANVTDTASIFGGPSGGTPSGTVTYSVYDDAACTNRVAGPFTTTTFSPSSSTSNYATGFDAGPSGAFGAGLANNTMYYVQASYGGGSGFSAASTNCGDETVTFGTPPTKPAATITTALVDGSGHTGTTLTVAPNTPVHDTASVTYNGAAQNGRITYYVYSDSTCETQVPGVNLGGGTSSGGVYPPSATVSLGTGTYYFQAIFSGNATVASSVGACTEVLTVKPIVLPPPPPVPCVCAHVSAYLNGFTAAATARLGFDLHSAITCTAGAGGCAGSLSIKGPSGTLFFTSKGKSGLTQGVSVKGSAATLAFSCAGPCLAMTVQPAYTLQWEAVKKVRVRYSVLVHGQKKVKFRTVLVADPRYTAKGRANRSFRMALTETCNGITTTKLLKLAFDKHGQLSYAKSDLNGDGTPDGKQLTDASGFR